MEIQKNYYAIIPANVRYDKTLCANAKLLYGEITALSNEKGHCWASNSYFAKLYQVEKETISRWVSQLNKKGYIVIEIEYKKGTKQIINRYIQINQYPIDKKINTPIDKKVKGNNIFNNNTSNNNKKNKEKANSNEFVDLIKEYSFSEKLTDVINIWLQYKKEKKQKYAKTGLIGLLNKIKKALLNNTEQFIIECINNSIANNWQGLFFDKKVETPKQEDNYKMNTREL